MAILHQTVAELFDSMPAYAIIIFFSQGSVSSWQCHIHHICEVTRASPNFRTEVGVDVIFGMAIEDSCSRSYQSEDNCPNNDKYRTCGNRRYAFGVSPKKGKGKSSPRRVIRLAIFQCNSILILVHIFSLSLPIFLTSNLSNQKR